MKQVTVLTLLSCVFHVVLCFGDIPTATSSHVLFEEKKETDQNNNSLNTKPLHGDHVVSTEVPKTTQDETSTLDHREHAASPKKIKTSPNPNITEIILWNNMYRNGKFPQSLDPTIPDNITNCVFKQYNQTYVLIHDFGMTITDLAKLKDKLLKKDDGNVILIVWDGNNNRSSESIYNQTVPIIGNLGKQVATILESFQPVGLDFAKLNVIGIGLGAHIAGIAGENVKTSFDKITGLDPASHHIDINNEANRLSSKDAKYVQVIHTNSCHEKKPPVWYECYGSYHTMGNTDFYPNGGWYQPYCTNRQSVDKKGKGRPPFCDHDLALEYYLESIDISLSDTVYLARPAQDYNHYKLGPIQCGEVPQYLGYYANPLAIASHYLNTSNTEPFGLRDPSCPDANAHHRTVAWAVSGGVIGTIFVVAVVITIIFLHKKFGFCSRAADQSILVNSEE